MERAEAILTEHAQLVKGEYGGLVGKGGIHYVNIVAGSYSISAKRRWLVGVEDLTEYLQGLDVKAISMQNTLLPYVTHKCGELYDNTPMSMRCLGQLLQRIVSVLDISTISVEDLPDHIITDVLEHESPVPIKNLKSFTSRVEANEAHINLF